MSIYGPGTYIEPLLFVNKRPIKKFEPWEKDPKLKYVHENFYTKDEVDKLLKKHAAQCNTTVRDLINQAGITGLDADNYYSKADIDNLLNTYLFDLSTYYTKTEVDTLILNAGGGSYVINSSNYFTKADIQLMFLEFVNLQAIIDASQNKALDDRIAELILNQKNIDASQNQSIDDKIRQLKEEQAIIDASQNKQISDVSVIYETKYVEVSTAITDMQSQQSVKDSLQDSSIVQTYTDSSANAAVVAENKVDGMVLLVKDGDVSVIVINNGITDVWGDYTE